VRNELWLFLLAFLGLVAIVVLTLAGKPVPPEVYAFTLAAITGGAGLAAPGSSSSSSSTSSTAALEGELAVVASKVEGLIARAAGDVPAPFPTAHQAAPVAPVAPVAPTIAHSGPAAP
jgi:hypothetical protein